MPRFFLQFSYNGTRFNGYQKQPKAITIQETIEKALTILAKKPIEIVGCGRTDTGVHAKNYFAHFDIDEDLNWQDNAKQYQLILSLNALIKPDIVVHKIHLVPDEAHARFDATSRTYYYYLDLERSPFNHETAVYIPYIHQANIELMQAAAQMLMNYTDFQTFCKTETDVKTYICHLTQSFWTLDKERNQLVYTITANRFLRGMIRLIVGMCLQVGTGKMTLEEVENALKNQKPLRKAYSAPGHGLYLTDIKYPYIN